MIRCLVPLLLVLALAWASNEEPLQEFVKANNLFAASVYKEILKSNNGNFLVSPYSAEAVLAFAQSGSKGNTAQELRNTLHLPDDQDKVESAVKASIPLLKGNDLYTLNTADKMYVKDGFSVNEGYKKSAVEIYGADVESIDFAKKTEAANTINKWVEDETNNKIKNLVDPEILGPALRVLLVNALYFKANWSLQFEEKLTAKENFHKTGEDTIEVDMMHHYAKWFNYHHCSELNAQFLELPFLADGDVSMVIALPNEKDGLTTLENQIDKVLLQQKFSNERVNVAIPKFKIESTIPFVPILKNLGVSSAFDSKLADFSGIAGQPGDLVINDVLQKTYIEVEEGGVEAAAATYVAIGLGSALVSEEPKNFVADHPFIFYIKAKNFIIFAGRVLSP